MLLSGTVNGERQSFLFPAQHFSEDSREASAALAALPRLWATRKVGYLLNQVRLNGPEQETIDQIVRLSIRYGIVTPYTSYLVTEPLPLGAAEQSRIAEDALRQMQAMPTQAVSGQAAVEKAAGQSSLANAEAPAPSAEEAGGKVKVVGAHSFVLKDGTWIDTAYDPSKGKTVKVAFLSDDFFALTKANPELAGAFALGPSVIAMADGTAYEVVAEGSQVPPVKQPPGQMAAADDGCAQSEPDAGVRALPTRAQPRTGRTHYARAGSCRWGCCWQGGQFLGQLIAQAPIQCGEAAGDLIVLDRDLDGFLAADQHAQRFGAGDGGVEQVALQHQVVLGNQGQHHGREFRALRLVHRDRVSQGKLVGFAPVIIHRVTFEIDGQGMLERVEAGNKSDVAIEDVLVVVIDHLHYPVAGAEGLPVQRFLRLVGSRRVERRLQALVEGAHPGWAAVHGRQHLDVLAPAQTERAGMRSQTSCCTQSPASSAVSAGKRKKSELSLAKSGA